MECCSALISHLLQLQGFLCQTLQKEALPGSVLIDVEPLMRELGAGQYRVDAQNLAVRGGAFDPFLTAAGYFVPALEAGLESALGFAKLHQVVGSAHA